MDIEMDEGMFAQVARNLTAVKIDDLYENEFNDEIPEWCDGLHSMLGCSDHSW